MVRKVVEMLISDLDGQTPADRTCGFGWKGTDYQIDLPKQEADDLEALLALYAEAGRSVKEPDSRTVAPVQVKVAPSQRKPAHRDPEQNKAVREWANANGYAGQVNGNRIPNHIHVAFQAAKAGRPIPDAYRPKSTPAAPPAVFSAVESVDNPQPEAPEVVSTVPDVINGHKLTKSQKRYVEVYYRHDGDSRKMAAELGQKLTSIHATNSRYRNKMGILPPPK